jgi:hypothetical protein
MDIKERFFTLEKKVNELVTMVHNTQETEKDIQVASIDKEQGVIPLDEFDTFRFVRVPKCSVREYLRVNKIWQHGIVYSSDMYFLMNPTEELKEYVNMILGYKLDYTKYKICFKYCGQKGNFEKDLQNKEINELYIFWYQGGCCFGRLSLIKEVRKELESKFFEIETHNIKVSKEFDLLLNKYIDGMNFSATITVEFKNKYKLLPHVSWFLTPLNVDSLKVSINSLTENQVTFNLLYGKKSVPENTFFHWMANGTSLSS